MKSGGVFPNVSGSLKLTAMLTAEKMQKTIMTENPLSSQPSMIKSTKAMAIPPMIWAKLSPMSLIWVGYNSRT